MKWKILNNHKEEKEPRYSYKKNQKEFHCGTCTVLNGSTINLWAKIS